VLASWRLTKAQGGAMMNNIISEQKCTVCGEIQPISNFYKTHKQCKSCMGKIAKKYNEENADKISMMKKQWREKYPEKNRMAQKKYRKKHSEKVSIKKKNYYNENRNKLTELIKEWHKKNPGKNKEYRHRRYARKSGNGGSFTAKEWKALCKLYDYKCLCCGEKKKLTVDHIIPLVNGGSSYIENIQPLCISCNCSKRTKSTDYRKIVMK